MEPSRMSKIYDAYNELALEPENFVLNQFSEFGNHLGHYTVTGRALAHVFEHVRHSSGHLPAATSATGLPAPLQPVIVSRMNTEPKSLR